jgi:hypothetical protein
MKKWLAQTFAPPYSGLTGLIAALVGVASAFTEPASLPILVSLFGDAWTKELTAVCALVLLVSRVPEVRALLYPTKKEKP